jgi:hypothetical protein
MVRDRLEAGDMVLFGWFSLPQECGSFEFRSRFADAWHREPHLPLTMLANENGLLLVAIAFEIVNRGAVPLMTTFSKVLPDISWYLP